MSIWPSPLASRLAGGVVLHHAVEGQQPRSPRGCLRLHRRAHDQGGPRRRPSACPEAAQRPSPRLQGRQLAGEYSKTAARCSRRRQDEELLFSPDVASFATPRRSGMLRVLQRAGALGPSR